MKNDGKKSMLLIAILGFVLILTGCQPKGDKPKEEEPVPPPEQIVTIDEAKGYYDNYSKRRVPLIQRYEDSINRRNMDPTDEKMQQLEQDQKNDANKSAQAMQGPERFDVARYVYYDYQTIKDYMAFIEQQAAAAKVDISTLRFYFSNYPDDEKFIHPRQNSIMISPALKKGDREYLFYIDDADPKNPTAVLLGDNFGPTKDGVGLSPNGKKQNYASFVPSLSNTNTLVNPYYNGQSLTLNRGGGIPPPYHEN